MRYYENYASARLNGGWRSNCQNSPYFPIPPEATTEEDALAHGYLPHRQVKEANRWALVITCHSKGFKGVADKVYLSVWAKQEEIEERIALR